MPNFFQAPLENQANEAANPRQQIRLSIAVSLKRIADILEHGGPKARQGLIESLADIARRH
jgi:hypothetical protein